jgi:hypothetical protein
LRELVPYSLQALHQRLRRTSGEAAPKATLR